VFCCLGNLAVKRRTGSDVTDPQNSSNGIRPKSKNYPIEATVGKARVEVGNADRVRDVRFDAENVLRRADRERAAAAVGVAQPSASGSSETRHRTTRISTRWRSTDFACPGPPTSQPQ